MSLQIRNGRLWHSLVTVEFFLLYFWVNEEGKVVKFPWSHVDELPLRQSLSKLIFLFRGQITGLSFVSSRTSNDSSHNKNDRLVSSENGYSFFLISKKSYSRVNRLVYLLPSHF